VATNPILQTFNLSKKFKNRWAVRKLNLEVYPGDIFGFLGPNGAGKSTTIRMLLSLIHPTEGDVKLFGHSVLKHRREALRKVGGIVEKPDFYLYLSAIRNLEIVGSLNGGTTRQRIEEVLALVGLGDRGGDRVKTFSHGMKQRLGIAQALLSDPELVILDEPTSGLDPQGMKEVRQLILSLAQEQKKTVFLSSHLLSEIEQVANRMAIINVGDLIVQGEVSKLMEQGEHRVVVSASPISKVRAALKSMKSAVKSFAITRKGDVEVVMDFKKVPALTRALVRKGANIHSIVPRRSLEDYFLTITESASGST